MHAPDIRSDEADLARPKLLDRGCEGLENAELGDLLAFASEIKAFLALPTFRARADPCALAEHFAFQNTLGDRTFFEGVKLLLLSFAYRVLDALLGWWKADRPIPQARIEREIAARTQGAGDLAPYCQVAVWRLRQRLRE